MNIKNTDIEQIPENWEIKKVGDFSKLITGNTPSKKNKNFWADGKIDFIKPPDLQNRLIDTFSEKISEKAAEKARIVDKGAILVSCIGNIGRVGYADHEMAFNQQINSVIPSKEVDNLYLFYALQYQKNQIQNLASFTTVPIVSKSKFAEVKIPLPPLPEQKKIASVLSAVQEAKEKTEAVIETTKALKKSMMKHLFTYGPVPVEEINTENCNNNYPNGWKKIKLKEIANPRKEIVDPGKLNKEKYLGLEHIESQGINSLGCGYSGEVKSAKNRFYKGDVLYGKLRPYLDKAIVAEFDGICSTDIIVLSTKNFDPFLLVYLLHTGQFVDFAISTMTGVNHPRTSWTKLKDFQFKLPNRKQRIKIVNYLYSIDRKILYENNRKQSLEKLFQSLLKNLMTGKLRVNDIELSL